MLGDASIFLEPARRMRRVKALAAPEHVLAHIFTADVWRLFRALLTSQTRGAVSVLTAQTRRDVAAPMRHVLLIRPITHGTRCSVGGKGSAPSDLHWQRGFRELRREPPMSHMGVTWKRRPPPYSKIDKRNSGIQSNTIM